MKRLLAFILLAPALAWGSKTPDDAQVDALADFSFGLFTNAPAHKIPKNASPNMRNVFVDKKFGAVVQGKGWTVVGGTGTLKNVRQIWEFILQDGTKKFHVFGSTTDNATSASGALLETTDFREWIILRSSLSALVDLHSAQVREKRWYTNGVDAVFNVSASTVLVLDGQTYSGTVTPNVPRSRFISYFQERVFLYNNVSDNSQVDFSSLKNSTGVDVAPDNDGAWSSRNRFYVGQGDGQVGTGMGAVNGQLIFGKNRSMYTLYGTGGASYYAQRSDAKSGFVSQESMTSLDGVMYGQCEDGIYFYTGDQMERISDNIAPDVENFRIDTTRVIQNTWDSAEEFNAGGYFQGATVTSSGKLATISTSVYINFAPDTYPSGVQQLYIGNGFRPGDVQFSSYAVYNPTFTFYNSNNGVYRVKQIDLWGNSQSAAVDVALYVKNQRTGIQERSDAINVVNTSGLQLRQFVFPQGGNGYFGQGNVWFTNEDLSGGNLRIQVTTTTPMTPGQSFDYAPATNPANTNIIIAAGNTGYYRSAITTIPTITNYGLFNSVNDPNGGAINFFYRAATSAVNIATYPFIPIAPGTIVGSTPTNNYFQWASTFSAAFSSNAPTISAVTLDHIEGSGSNTRSFGFAYDNRFWLIVSTESTGNFPMIYVKTLKSNSNPLGFMPFDGINVRCAIFSSDGILYGGSASSGTIIRMDYGDTYGGAAINAYIESPDLVLGDPYTFKELWEYQLDAERESGASLRVGTSMDGADWNENTVSLDGTGRAKVVIRNVNGGRKNYGKHIRFRFANSVLAKGMTVNSFQVIYRPTKIR